VEAWGAIERKGRPRRQIQPISKKPDRAFLKQVVERKGMDFFLCVLGMVLVVEGLPYFAFPENMKKWIAMILEMPENTLRKFGLVMMFIGLGLVYLGRS
jgi:uncharacterized protein